jgi:hypothetical protein
MTSLRKTQANRSNALRSTGPRSAAGRAVAAQNARRHGLSVVLPQEVVGHKVHEVSQLILGEGLDEYTARELAVRIVDFERNLEHERATFKPLFTTHGIVSDEPLDEAEEAEKAGIEEVWQLLTDELSMPDTDDATLKA